MKRPITGDSKSDTANQPNKSNESDIVQPLKFAGLPMIGRVPCQEIKTYVTDGHMKPFRLALALHVFASSAGPVTWQCGPAFHR